MYQIRVYSKDHKMILSEDFREELAADRSREELTSRFPPPYEVVKLKSASGRGRGLGRR